MSNSSATMSDCNHEEADTRMMNIDIEHSLVSGAKNIGICSQDTDVVIIVLAFFHQLQAKYNFDHIVIDFGLENRYSI